MQKGHDQEFYGEAEDKKIYPCYAIQKGDHFLSFCPLCEDPEMNLVIDEAKKTMRCRQCDRILKIVEKEKIMPKEPKIEKAKKAARIRSKKSKDDYQEKSKKVKGQGEFVFKYIYHDSKGNPAHATLRWKNPKGFSQQHWDKKKKKWITGLGPKKITYLYNLVKIIKSKGMVLVCEGEKDVIKLTDPSTWDLIATTAPMGVGKWKNEYSEWLRGRDIILIPDQNDEKKKNLGIESMEKVAYSLQGKAKSIKILLLPIKDKKIFGYDVCDWIEEGGRKEKLLELIEKTKEVELKKLIKKVEKRIEEKKARPKFIDPKLIKKKKWTIRPGLINLVKDETINWLLKDEAGNLYIKKEEIEDSFDDKDEITERVIRYPRQDLPIGYATPEVLKMQGKIKFDELLNEIITFIETYLEMPEPAHYLIMALWILHTYLMEKFNTTPILSYYGVHETGKTRAGEVLRELSLRGYELTTPTEASIFREAHHFKTCLIIDEVKLGGWQANEPVRDLIHGRYKRGPTICRVEITKQGEDQLEYYNVYGPTVLCSTRYVEATLKSRCIEFLMQQNQNPEVEQPISYGKAQDLRNKLTIFRAAFIDLDLPEYKRIAPRRLNELLLPLYQLLMIVSPERKEEFNLIIEALEKKRAEERGLTLEVDILEFIIEKLGGLVGLLCITTEEIAKGLNEGVENKKDKVSTRYIGMMCNRLGFEAWRDREKPKIKRGYRIRPELLESLCKKYEIKYSEM